MYWPADTYLVPSYSKGHVNHGERKPPSLSSSVQKKNTGLVDVCGISTVIMSAVSSPDGVPLFDLNFRFGLLFGLAATMVSSNVVSSAADLPLETALRLALGMVEESLHE